jgi:hypothetical protein
MQVGITGVFSKKSTAVMINVPAAEAWTKVMSGVPESRDFSVGAWPDPEAILERFARVRKAAVAGADGALARR